VAYARWNAPPLLGVMEQLGLSAGSRDLDADRTPPSRVAEAELLRRRGIAPCDSPRCGSFEHELQKVRLRMTDCGSPRSACHREELLKITRPRSSRPLARACRGSNQNAPVSVLEPLHREGMSNSGRRMPRRRGERRSSSPAPCEDSTPSTCPETLGHGPPSEGFRCCSRKPSAVALDLALEGERHVHGHLSPSKSA